MAEVERFELRERIEEVAADLPDVTVEAGPDGLRYGTGGVAFAVVGTDRAAFRLRPDVASAATRTPNVRASERGAGWVELVPPQLDQFAIDRAESWFESACRYAQEGGTSQA